MHNSKADEGSEQPNVFVSYAHADSDAVLKEIGWLSDQQFSVYYDAGISLGASWREELAESILGCQLFLLFASPASVKSNHCQGELHLALDNDVPVLVVHLQPTDMTPGLKLALGDRQQLFKYEYEPTGYRARLMTGIEDVIANPILSFAAAGNYRMSQKGQMSILRRTFIATLVIAICGILAWNFTPSGQLDEDLAPSNTIAVMPFLNLNKDGDEEYFSDGISEEILNSLSAIPGLIVTSRTSSFSLRDANLDIPAIGKRLHVSRVLEGSVRKFGNRLRITVQLVDAVAGVRLWSSTYERELEDIFVIQEDISDSVVSALQIQINAPPQSVPGAHSQMVNVQAYDLYLLGRHSLHKRTAASITRSIGLFEESISRDPGFALAYTGVADAYNLLTAYGNMTGPDAAARMGPHLERALNLQPDLSEVHNSLGAMYENLGDLERAEVAYQKAIALNPNSALSLMWLGNLLINESRLEEASEAFSEALKLDPLNVIVNINVARTAMLRGRFAEGVQALDHAIALQPDSPHAITAKSVWMGRYGHLQEALELAQIAVELDDTGSQNLVNLISAYIHLANFEMARKWVAQANVVNPDYWRVVWITAEFHHLNNEVEVLEQYIQEKLSALLGSDQASRDLKSAYQWYGVAKMRQGHDQLAARYFDRAAEVDYQNDVGEELRFRVIRALAYQRSGDLAGATELLRVTAQYARRMAETGYETPSIKTFEASIYAVQGDFERCMALLKDARQLGFRKHLLLERDPSWDSIRDKPEFQAFLKSLSSDQSAGNGGR